MKRLTITVAVLLFAVLSSLSCQNRNIGKEKTEHKDNAQVMRREAFELKKTCFDVGRRIYEIEFAKPSGGQMPMNPLYAYNKELNTCVMFVGFVGKNTYGEFIIDTLTNEELGSVLDSDPLSNDAVQFGMLKKRLFSKSFDAEQKNPTVTK